MGLSIEYRWKEFSLFLNAENFTDTRQTRYESIYTGTRQSPEFNEIWAPTDGFIFNGGLKIRVW
jgi:iron complex outermembrane receptor protein